jgi:hypothetical protein
VAPHQRINSRRHCRQDLWFAIVEDLAVGGLFLLCETFIYEFVFVDVTRWIDDFRGLWRGVWTRISWSLWRRHRAVMCAGRMENFAMIGGEPDRPSSQNDLRTKARYIMDKHNRMSFFRERIFLLFDDVSKVTTLSWFVLSTNHLAIPLPYFLPDLTHGDSNSMLQKVCISLHGF